LDKTPKHYDYKVINSNDRNKMSATFISALTFIVVFLSAIAGIIVQSHLPDHHLSEESKTIIKASRSVVIGLAALTLGLLIATAKESFDTKGAELKSSASKMIVINRLLLKYNQKSSEANMALKTVVLNGIKILEKTDADGIDPKILRGEGIDNFLNKLLELPEENAQEKWIKSSILSLWSDMAISRWKIYENSAATVSPLFIFTLIFWIMTIFFSLGLIAPLNLVVIAAILMADISMTGAILLTLELDQPYGGLIHISTEPLRMALQQFIFID
jgi:DNA-binding ferritin-like protein (Dps family)